MDFATLQKILSDDWAVDVRDTAPAFAIASPEALGAALPMGPNEVLKCLNISGETLIGMLRSGSIGRPTSLGHGRVAWRADQIEAIAPQR